MRKKLLFACFALGLAAHSPVRAATLIETQEPEAGILQLWVADAVMRIDDQSSSGYSILDAKRRTMFVVSPPERQVMDMSGSLQRLSAGTGERSPGKIVVSHAGQGPAIAGYATERYVVSAEGTKCQEVFASVQAMEDTDMGDLVALVDEFSSAMMAGTPTGQDDPCDSAEHALDYRKIGLPLRTLDAGGQEDYLVRRIELGVEGPPGGFSFPDDYRVVDFAAMMQEMMQQTPQSAE